jgi:serine/threonine protein kinase/Tol biopolymer transport system component
MGEVYRGRDATLNRDVAIKVLPAVMASDPERMARFKREAQVLASLNHPNIAHVYGFEPATLADGSAAHVLAMEMVEGEDLAERLKRGAIPAEEAVAIAKQIAQGLEEAHEHGIIHRDLKPANVKVTPDGKVKILDFGLAKAMEADPSSAAVSPQLSHSPTMSRHMTEAGMILGTAAYMSPEQARGKPVDKRADIWAFGVVLYEMLTGRRLFSGETVSDVLAAVLTREPEWAALPEGTAPGVERLLRRCLERDPRRRLHDIADARLDLEEPPQTRPLDTGFPPRRSRSALWSSRAALLATGAILGWGADRLLVEPRLAGSPATSRVRYEIPIPTGHSFEGDLALSPDRRRLAFSAADDALGIRGLWIRSLDALESRKVENVEDARFPFWSPDGRQLGFFAGGELRVLDTVSGAQRVLARTGPYGEVRGASWSKDGVIVFNPRYTGGLLRVPDEGGAVEPASRVRSDRGEGTHRLPNFLPDGKHFTFYMSPGGGSEPGEVCLGQLGSLEHACLGVASSSGFPTPSGQLLFVRGRALLAQRLDLDSRKLVGDPVPLGPEFPSNTGTSGQRSFTVAGDSLVFHLGAPSQNRVVWVDRKGAEQQVVYDRAADWVFNPRVAPDGRRIALAIYRPNSLGAIWVLDPARRGETPLTTEGDNQGVIWSRSGRELAILHYAAGGDASVLRADPEKPQSARLWKIVPGLFNVDSWGPNDRSVLLTVSGTETASDIFELTDAGELRPVLATRAAEHSPALSPDGRWLAYVSDVGGREDVYVAPASGQGSTWKVSTAGGNEPLWRSDGRELFYMAPGGRLQAVAVTLGSDFVAGPPQALFSGRFDSSGNRVYDVSSDGKRFLVNLNKSSPGSPIVVLLGLDEEIRARSARQSAGR